MWSCFFFFFFFPPVQLVAAEFWMSCRPEVEILFTDAREQDITELQSTTNEGVDNSFQNFGRNLNK